MKSIEIKNILNKDLKKISNKSFEFNGESVSKGELRGLLDSDRDFRMTLTLRDMEKGLSTKDALIYVIENERFDTVKIYEIEESVSSSSIITEKSIREFGINH